MDQKPSVRELTSLDCPTWKNGRTKLSTSRYALTDFGFLCMQEGTGLFGYHQIKNRIYIPIYKDLPLLFLYQVIQGKKLTLCIDLIDTLADKENSNPFPLASYQSQFLEIENTQFLSCVEDSFCLERMKIEGIRKNDAQYQSLLFSLTEEYQARASLALLLEKEKKSEKREKIHCYKNHLMEQGHPLIATITKKYGKEKAGKMLSDVLFFEGEMD